MTLKVYADRLSEPSRAVILFCKLNGIDFEEVRIHIPKRQHLTPEYQEINPMKKVPAIMNGRFKLSESHAIMIYLASVFPGVADHWYPADASKRAKIHLILDWHHSNLRQSAVRYILSSTLGHLIGQRLNPEAAAKAEKLLSASLAKIESIWLKGNGPFLLGSPRPSIADLSLVCQIMQLEVVNEKDRDRILSPHKKILKWIDETKIAFRPHFDEVHAVVYEYKEKQKQKQQQEGAETKFTAKTAVHSRM